MVRITEPDLQFTVGNILSEAGQLGMSWARIIFIKDERRVKFIENIRINLRIVKEIRRGMAPEMMEKQYRNLQTVSKFFETNHDPIVNKRACTAKENWKCIDNNQNRVGMFADKCFNIISQAIENRA